MWRAGAVTGLLQYADAEFIEGKFARQSFAGRGKPGLGKSPLWALYHAGRPLPSMGPGRAGDEPRRNRSHTMVLVSIPGSRLRPPAAVARAVSVPLYRL